MIGAALADALTIDTDAGDTLRVVGILRALDAHGDATVFTVPGQPERKPRHRSGNGQAYSSTGQRVAEQSLGMALRTCFPQPLSGNLAVVAIFYRANRQVIDRDNLDKLLSDAGNGIAWVDDVQITGGAQLVELDRARPRTVIAVAAHASTMTR